MSLSYFLARLVERSRRRAGLVVICGLLLMLLCGLIASQRLGVTTDTDALFADTLPWRQWNIAWNRDFPQFNNLLVMVVDAKEPEEAEVTAASLAQALSADTRDFDLVTRPDASPWFEKNAFLFLDPPELEGLLNQTIDAQPFLGQLSSDPSARGLFGALGLIAQGVEHGEANLGPFRPALTTFHEALADALKGHPQPLSWQNLLAGSLSAKAGEYKFVLAQPRLNFNALQAGGAATDVARAAIRRLPYVQRGDARVRITGSVALADEEFATVAQGALVGTIGSVLLVTLWLLLAVRSWRLIVPILSTLILGLSLTTGFAALAVGTLNVISVAFAILFVGIAVDFAIQFSVRYRSARQRNDTARAALAGVARRVGPQILVAACATSAGFLAFVPTDFAGVAELGLIAGVGMLIAFASTILFLPAALTLCRPRPETEEIGFAWLGAVETRLLRVRGSILAAFVALAVVGIVLLPRITFDSDPLHTKDPHTEAMRTLRDLMNSPLTNPYSADDLEADQARADALAAKLSKLPLVAQTLTLTSFVPQQQQTKLAMIADAADVLFVSLSPPPTDPKVSPAEIRAAAGTTAAALGTVLPKLAADDPLRPLASDLAALSKAPDPIVTAANDALVRFLPMQLSRLRTALAAKPVTVADVPPELSRDWRLPDGRARVQALAKPEARGSEGLHAFARQVLQVAPNAGGSVISIVATAATIISAFKTAAVSAIAAIAVILFLVLRRLLHVAVVMAPLLLSALMTVLAVVLLPMPLNFANIIALPLLLGVGVSFNIYFVMNWRDGAQAFLGSATARAIIFSALTTGTAFGSLALSHHPGTASMGELLLISLGCSLIATLVFEPVLLHGLRRRLRPPPGTSALTTRPYVRTGA